MPPTYSIETIENALKATGWNLARVKLLARFLLALIVCRTVCLTEIANVLPGTAQTASNYKRLQRFLAHFDFDPLVIARLTLAWMRRSFGLEAPFVLAIDRTNWKFAKTDINILKLAIVHNGVGFPLLWMLLGKAGNSSLEERQALLVRYRDAFGAASIAYLCGDREFGGRAFLSWLRQEGIPFVMRIKGDVRVTNARGERKTARGLFWSHKVGEVMPLGERYVYSGKKPMRLHVSGMRIKGDFLVVVSDRPAPCEDLLSDYSRRWGIETLFGSLKKRGFDLEATHLRDSARLSRLLCVLSLAFCWSYMCGAEKFAKKPWKARKHGRLPVSIFRCGLDFLQRLLVPLCGERHQGRFDSALGMLPRLVDTC